MRRLSLMLVLIAAQRLGAECIAVTPQPQGFFFRAESVFFASAETMWTLRVERVVQGKVVPNEVVTVRSVECHEVRPGKRYLVTRSCGDPEYWCVQWVGEEDAPRFLAYLATTHAETQQSIMKRFRVWQLRKAPASTFQRWLATTLIAPRDESDERLARDLVDDLGTLFEELVDLEARDVRRLRQLKRTELPAIARLMETFPRETADEFDARADAANPGKAVYRDEYEDELLNAITAAVEAARN